MIKYLSDKIYIDLISSSMNNQYMTYTVQIRQLGESDWEDVFIGRFFNNSTRTKPVRIYLNDILESLPKNTENMIPLYLDSDFDYILSPNNICYEVQMKLGDGTIKPIGTILSYHKDGNIQRGLDFINGPYPIYNILEQRTNYLPRVPHLNYTSENYWLNILLYRKPEYIDSMNGAIPLIGFDSNNEIVDALAFYDDYNEIINLSVTYNDLSYLFPYCDSFGVLSTNPYKITPVAYIDHCPSDYYVIWQDRTGAYQCQPFSKKTTYKENIDTSYLTNELGEERPYSKSIQSEWTLNSDWLSDEGYKAHESLLTSPKVHLFDTKNDMLWEVNCTNSQWEDKTKQNKKLFNLTVTLKDTTTQNIIY